MGKAFDSETWAWETLRLCAAHLPLCLATHIFRFPSPRPSLESKQMEGPREGRENGLKENNPHSLYSNQNCDFWEMAQ